MNFADLGSRRLCGLRLSALALLGALLVLAPASRASAVAGVCPDGSVFIVQDPEDAPCPRAKLVDASDVPPLRPDYLPRPYLWQVDQQLQSEQNPYNLVDRARALRELRTGGRSTPEPEPRSPMAAPSTSAPVGPNRVARAVAQPPAPRFADDDLRDLVRIIAFRQELAPASLVASDAAGAVQLALRFAYSPGAEQRVLGQLGLSEGRVMLFSARAGQPDLDFYPNFLVAQAGATFRPDPDQRAQSGFLVGASGALPRGELCIGYLVLPGRFDLAAPLRIWWNDRDVQATLAPAGG